MRTPRPHICLVALVLLASMAAALVAPPAPAGAAPERPVFAGVAPAAPGVCPPRLVSAPGEDWIDPGIPYDPAADTAGGCALFRHWQNEQYSFAIPDPDAARIALAMVKHWCNSGGDGESKSPTGGRARSCAETGFTLTAVDEEDRHAGGGYNEACQRWGVDYFPNWGRRDQPRPVLECTERPTGMGRPTSAGTIAAGGVAAPPAQPGGAPGGGGGFGWGALNNIGDRIGEQTQRKVQLSSKVEPDLLGGIVVRVGNSIIDASIRNRLEQLRKQVAKAT